jgi:predicted acylesterase/phospholipase RssA
MRGLVIGGGGSLGAFSAGTLAGLNRDYDIVIGVSTGALMAPLVASRQFSLLKEAYTSVGQEDIFSLNPFTKEGKISKWNAIKRSVQGKESVGETHNLRKTIEKFFPQAVYDAIKAEVVVGAQAVNVSPAYVKYFSSKESSFSTFKDGMWASASPPFIGSIVTINGIEYVDGGVSEVLPMSYLYRRGCMEIDVMLHEPIKKEGSITKDATRDMFQLLSRIYSITRTEITSDDLATGLLNAQLCGAKVNLYYLPEKLTDNVFIFNKEQMSGWWKMGYDLAFDESRIVRYNFS